MTERLSTPAGVSEVEAAIHELVPHGPILSFTG